MCTRYFPQDSTGHSSTSFQNRICNLTAATCMPSIGQESLSFTLFVCIIYCHTGIQWSNVQGPDMHPLSTKALLPLSTEMQAALQQIVDLSDLRVSKDKKTMQSLRIQWILLSKLDFGSAAARRTYTRFRVLDTVQYTHSKIASGLVNSPPKKIQSNRCQ
jgi:hypothetical protein